MLILGRRSAMLLLAALICIVAIAQTSTAVECDKNCRETAYHYISVDGKSSCWRTVKITVINMGGLMTETEEIIPSCKYCGAAGGACFSGPGTVTCTENPDINLRRYSKAPCNHPCTLIEGVTMYETSVFTDGELMPNAFSVKLSKCELTE